MAEHKENPLLAARPPETDPITYLTIVEYNLSKENLPVLHEVLQDADLTANIGWDLVQLLLPLLPESQECLKVIAKLGNPREVILKVTEALRLLHFDDPLDESSLEKDENVTARQLGGLSVNDGPTDGQKAEPAETSHPESHAPLVVQQFQTLLSMLSILHPRVKTKYPSRFLSTSLQAVLASSTMGERYRHDLTNSMIQFIKTISGAKRPHLPPRMSSSVVPLVSTLTEAEAQPAAQTETPAAEDSQLSNRLLQAFLTHVLEDYMAYLSSEDDVPGLCWSSRLQEKLHPERIIPNKATFTDRFANEAPLKDRTIMVGQIVALAQDLDLNSKDLFAAVMDEAPEPTGQPATTDDPPESADEVPFSKTGSLLLLTARNVAEKLYDASQGSISIPIFPEHATILTNFLGTDSAANIGTEHESLIDAILALGLIALEDDKVGEPNDDEHFTKYLQTLSLLSANCPSPTLRYHAHYLTSTILRSHPSDLVRLSFIRDTLEHCPYENLKASAVAWLKGETIEANLTQPVPPTPTPTPVSFDPASQPTNSSGPLSATSLSPPSIFATPVALSTCSPFLFPDLTHDLSGTSLQESYETFKLNLSFYLATLNFYYLLLTAKPLHEHLDVAGLHTTADIGGSYLGPLREAITRYREALKEGGELYEMEGEEGAKHGDSDLRLLEDVMGRVEEGVKKLNGVA